MLDCPMPIQTLVLQYWSCPVAVAQRTAHAGVDAGGGKTKAPLPLLLESKSPTFGKINHPPVTSIVLAVLHQDRNHQSHGCLPQQIHNLTRSGGCTFARTSRTLVHQRVCVGAFVKREGMPMVRQNRSNLTNEIWSRSLNEIHTAHTRQKKSTYEVMVNAWRSSSKVHLVSRGR